MVALYPTRNEQKEINLILLYKLDSMTLGFGSWSILSYIAFGMRRGAPYSCININI
jgi:hypothetical protein